MRPVRAHVDRKYVKNLTNRLLMWYYKKVAVDDEEIWSAYVRPPETVTGVFFTVGKSLLVISSVHRMIVVILKKYIPCVKLILDM